MVPITVFGEIVIQFCQIFQDMTFIDIFLYNEFYFLQVYKFHENKYIIEVDNCRKNQQSYIKDEVLDSV